MDLNLIAWIFNIGYLFQHVGTLLQIRRIEKRKNIDGVSIDTQILFLVGAIARCFWVSDTILKKFKITYIELFLAIVTLSYTLCICLFKYNKEKSAFNLLFWSRVPIVFRWYFLLIVTGVFSFIYYPGKDDKVMWDIQMFVSLNIYTEAAGLIPQIFSFISEKDSRSFSTFYLIFLAVSRVFRLFFWIKLYLQTHDFEFLIVADALHVFVFIAFVYFFYSNFDNVLLPTNESTSEKSEKKIF
jgi:uncharacterized protein with PQ loop repeat